MVGAHKRNLSRLGRLQPINLHISFEKLYYFLNENENNKMNYIFLNKTKQKQQQHDLVCFKLLITGPHDCVAIARW